MIVSPDAETINDIVLLEAWKRPVDHSIRAVYTEIDQVLMLCNRCAHGPCKIAYWVRGSANTTECLPQDPCCPKCPQWKCNPCGGGGSGTSTKPTLPTPTKPPEETPTPTDLPPTFTPIDIWTESPTKTFTETSIPTETPSTSTVMPTLPTWTLTPTQTPTKTSTPTGGTPTWNGGCFNPNISARDPRCQWFAIDRCIWNPNWGLSRPCPKYDGTPMKTPTWTETPTPTISTDNTSSSTGNPWCIRSDVISGTMSCQHISRPSNRCTQYRANPRPCLSSGSGHCVRNDVILGHVYCSHVITATKSCTAYQVAPRPCPKDGGTPPETSTKPPIPTLPPTMTGSGYCPFDNGMGYLCPCQYRSGNYCSLYQNQARCIIIYPPSPTEISTRTTPSSGRFSCYESRYTGTPPIRLYFGNYSCDQHFCNLQDKFAHRNIIYLEDDAILLPDFREKMNAHLAELPDDWQLFVAGYVRCSELPETTEGANKVSDLIRRNAKTLSGTQCLVLKGGEWRHTLTNDIRDHSLYNHNRQNGLRGFDMNLVQWCRAKSVSCYVAARSFVGQGDCVSLILGKYRPRMGL